MKDRPLQLFSDEYLAQTRELTPEQVVEFLENFRRVAWAGRKAKSKLISLKIQEDLLSAFKMKAHLEGRPYQTLIKDLMTDWLLRS